jgi:hypothetical protein
MTLIEWKRLDGRTHIVTFSEPVFVVCGERAPGEFFIPGGLKPGESVVWTWREAALKGTST